MKPDILVVDDEPINVKILAAILEANDYQVRSAFSGEDCAAHTPAPDIYLKALKALGLTADKAIAVEDSPTGIASAKAAGLKVLALKPRHGEPLDQSAADCIITQLMDVKEHLD